MAALTSHSRSMLPILFGLVVLHTVVALAPHHHETATVTTTAGLADHWCGLDTTEIFPVAEVQAPVPCLACAVPAPAFDRSVTLPATAVKPSKFTEPPSPSQPCPPSRRWRHQLRAPPAHT